MGEESKDKDKLDDRLEDLISRKIERQVRETIEHVVPKEEEKRFRQLKSFVGLVGLVGLGTFGTLSNYLIEKAVESKLERRTGNISDSLEFVRFYTLTMKLELGTSFSNTDKEAIMSYLRKASKNENIRHSREFLAALEQVTKAFVSAGQSGQIDEIFSLYEQETLSTNGLIENLIHHYGQSILGRSAAPKDDPAMSRFEKLERVSDGAKVPELALMYRLLITYQKGPDKTEVAVVRLIERAKELSTADTRNFFMQLFQKTKVENWQRRSTPEGKVIEKLTRSFLRIYEEHISKIFNVSSTLIRRVWESGVDENALEDLARTIVSS